MLQRLSKPIQLCASESCIFRRTAQPTVNVHIGGSGHLDVSVNDGKFTRPLTPTPGGAAPGTPNLPMQCSSSADESFDPEALTTEAAREAKMQRQAQSRGASSKAKSSPRHDDDDDARKNMPGSSNSKQLPKPPKPRRDCAPVQEVWVATNQGRGYHRIGCDKLHGANNVVSLSRADAVH